MSCISESDEHSAEQVSRKAVRQGWGLCKAWAQLTCFCCPRRSSGAKKQQAHESSRPLSIERPGAVHPWVSAQLRSSVQPSHLFIQDPTMPPNPAPNPLTQLEASRCFSVAREESGCKETLEQAPRRPMHFKLSFQCLQEAGLPTIPSVHGALRWCV